ncbi:hypothetical protein [Mycolicibacterium helvum]|uniref:Uncharacterized protein n=1 Tax=Mycolicibacterium helvum TaxID=1534349 RepID=A0A7I7T766_9MYCO|nr:hypothetical protein [Mycolicibacterium helvum]BBY65102.1 hypothetical protein MHEL_33450 [Mycolicibacterium helvum]
MVKVAARRLSDAHGATVVLLDHALCHYADEDSMSPLWKGQDGIADPGFTVADMKAAGGD